MENFPGEVCLVPLGNSKREGSKSLFSRRILAQNTVFQGYFARKMEIPGEGVFHEAGNPRGGCLTHKWKFQGSSTPPGRFKIAISQFEGGYNSLFDSLLIFCFFIAVEHFDGQKRKICFL